MKRAVILFNLGGPDSLDAVQPFLFNLFRDPAIISLPNPLRWVLAKLISSKRLQTAKEIYSHLGGSSPIGKETHLQASALEEALKKFGEYKVFYTMRYWHPFSNEVMANVKEYEPDEIILLPLYPQFSTTTTSSSLGEWSKLAKKNELKIPFREICCYYKDPKFIESYANLTLEKYKEASRFGKPRLLFSAHGIPLNRIKRGDPYQFQIESTVEAIVQKMNISDLDYIVCYQSKVGPLKWLQPSTEYEITESSKQGRVIVISPISFVSEHSETLVELDIEYKHLAERLGCKHYFRVPAVRDSKLFIEALRDLCVQPVINVCNSCLANCAGPCAK